MKCEYCEEPAVGEETFVCPSCINNLSVLIEEPEKSPDVYMSGFLLSLDKSDVIDNEYVDISMFGFTDSYTREINNLKKKYELLHAWASSVIAHSKCKCDNCKNAKSEILFMNMMH